METCNQVSGKPRPLLWAMASPVSQVLASSPYSLQKVPVAKVESGSMTQRRGGTSLMPGLKTTKVWTVGQETCLSGAVDKHTELVRVGQT